MKKYLLILSIVLLAPQYGALAHQEKHVHSQWIQQQLNQMNRSIQQLKARIDQLQNTGAGVVSAPANSNQGNKTYLNEICSSGEQKLCRKGCPAGWKLDNAMCVGKGSIGKTHHQNGLVSCYCFSQNDPNCQVESVTATCVKP